MYQKLNEEDTESYDLESPMEAYLRLKDPRSETKGIWRTPITATSANSKRLKKRKLRKNSVSRYSGMFPYSECEESLLKSENDVDFESMTSFRMIYESQNSNSPSPHYFIGNDKYVLQTYNGQRQDYQRQLADQKLKHLDNSPFFIQGPTELSSRLPRPT
ncbi:hypothetical protein RF11_00698 [Thelohanellus kitauei]|uniref:Uncharacterized protein n=1 Tax=Thelohanellus kitauei TaxID=669202 RepID=A0A0C2NEA4_THEKT|nr:hypothetical protein RF11_00698 [Thelohanellus kitauei]